MRINVPKFTYLYGVTSKRTHYEKLRLSHYNDESAEPTSSTDAIFDIIGNFGTVQA